MKKKRSLMSIFVKGVLFFFSLEDNPIKRYDRERRKYSDIDYIAMDWMNIGNDIRNAMNRYETAGAAN